jgi:Fe-S cluster assembly protein SufD
MGHIIDPKLADFCALFKTNSIASLQALHAPAAQYLENAVFPTTREERFKYTRLQKLLNASFSPETKLEKEQLQTYAIVEDAINIYMNGSLLFLPENLPTGLTIEALNSTSNHFEAEAFKDVFSAMNCLYANNGCRIVVKANTTLEKPIQIIQVHAGAAAFFRHQFVFEKNAEAKVILANFSLKDAVGFSHTHSAIQVAQDARVQIQKIQACDAAHFDFNEERSNQASNSVLEINTYTLSGGLVRNDLAAIVQGEHAETKLNGAYLLADQQHVANYTTIDHQVPNCESFETYKGIIDGAATAVFNGKVFVRKDAQKTNAFQSNANVLLSETASVNSKPELEIYADDVKCSHGSTTGQLDDQALFYLRARGLSEKSAKTLLLQAFMAEVLEVAEPEALSQFIISKIQERFAWEN